MVTDRTRWLVHHIHVTSSIIRARFYVTLSLDQYIFAYSKGEPLRLETLTLFRTTQNPTIYTLFRATPSMFSNNTNFSTETHVPSPRFPRYGQYLMHAHNHTTPAVAATFSRKISGSRLLWTTVSSSLGFIKRYMTPALYASSFIDKHRLQASLILMSILSGEKKERKTKPCVPNSVRYFYYLYFQVGSLVGRELRSTQDQASVFGHRLKAEFLSCKSVNYILGKLSGAPNDGFLLNALKTPFRLSRVLLDL